MNPAIRSWIALLSVLALFLPAQSGAADPATAKDAEAHRCLALTLYHEARSEGREGMEAVGWVVLNRVTSPKFPNGICKVVHQGGPKPPCQWSWWCDGKSDRPTSAKSWALARSVADDLLSASPPADPVAGALYFHRDSLTRPNWLENREQTAHLGHHIFYR